MDLNTLPQYLSHKVVRAARIIDVTRFPNPSAGICDVMLRLEGQDSGHQVSEGWWNRHKPKPGMFFILYADGYQSVSPADAFMSGYTTYPNPSEKAYEKPTETTDNKPDVATRLTALEAQVWTLEHLISSRV